MKMILLGLILILGGCTSSRDLFGRYYWVGGGPTGISRAQLEQRVSSLYTDGTFTANSQEWLPLLIRDAKQHGGQVTTFGLNLKEGYSLDARGRKGYLVYDVKTQTFFSFKFWNFRGFRSQHTPCDLVIENISVLQPDSTLKRVQWQNAEAALTNFKQYLLPAIRERAKQAQQY
jgi:hypothetical protein